MNDELPTPRFFIDHGVIHDRHTGKHIGPLDPDYPQSLCDLLNGFNDEHRQLLEAESAIEIHEAARKKAEGELGAARQALALIRAHHVNINGKAGREPSRSKTIALCDAGLEAALAQSERGDMEKDAARWAYYRSAECDIRKSQCFLIGAELDHIVDAAMKLDGPT